ncbi:MAG: hypothetical protein Kow0027_07730 [Saprospiraceae bacterium]
MVRNILAIFFLFCFATTQAQEKLGYQIKVKIDNFDQKELYLGYYYGDKQYLKDTAYLASNGWFYFEGEEKLPGGLYLIVMPPDNNFFQMVINDDEDQWFSMETDAKDAVDKMKIEGSPDNRLFYDYLLFLEKKRPEADKLKEELDALPEGDKKREKVEAKIKALDEEVMAFQQKIIREHPKTMTAAIIKANLPLNPPEFKEDEKGLKAFRWMRQHWFDNLDLADERMLRTPVLQQKVDYFIQKMTVQHPDSISEAIDQVLEAMRPAEENFKYFLIHFLNEYAKSKIVGMDAVYVHLGLKYYATGQAPWTDPEQLEKIVDNAKKLEPLLIGNKAPNLLMETQDGSHMSLHQFKSPITVLFFWDPDCSHCKKSMPDMVKFAQDYKDKGVAVFAVCTKLVTRDDQGNLSLKEVNKCWDTIKEKNMDVFFNTVDPYHRSRYKSVYDIRSTPQIYVLDEDKTILSKRIGAEQLPEVIDFILEKKAKEAQESGQ